MKPEPIIYCSGPLFSPEEVAGMDALANVLEQAGYKTFLPHRDGLEPYVLPFLDGPFASNVLGNRDAIDKAIFALDVFQLLERCQGIVMNMNGRVPDEGAVVEASIAYAHGKPLVLYKQDARSVFGGRDNAMIFGLTGEAPVKILSALPEAIKKALTNGNNPSVYPPELQKTLTLGKTIWQVLEPINRLGLNKGSSAKLLQKVLTLAQ